MGHIPEDENFDEFMNASAEDWSKPEEAPKVPEISEESTDRWGSSTADKEVVDSGDRWGSEPKKLLTVEIAGAQNRWNPLKLNRNPRKKK